MCVCQMEWNALICAGCHTVRIKLLASVYDAKSDEDINGLDNEYDFWCHQECLIQLYAWFCIYGCMQSCWPQWRNNIVYDSTDQCMAETRAGPGKKMHPIRITEFYKDLCRTRCMRMFNAVGDTRPPAGYPNQGLNYTETLKVASLKATTKCRGYHI